MADKQGIPILPEAEAVAERLKLRNALKMEYRKQLTHPFRHGHGEGGYLFDPAVQRFQALRATQLDFFKVTPKTTGLGLLFTVLPFVSFWYFLKKHRDGYEHQYRTGQVAYKDRQFKFL